MKVMLRAATLQDIPAIQGIALQQMKRYPLRPDKHKIRELLTQAVSGRHHFAMVADVGGDVGAVLVGLTGDNLWAQRQNCNILLWESRVPGAGAALLRIFRDWVISRRAIKVAGFCVEADVEESALALAERIGFAKYGGSYLLYN